MAKEYSLEQSHDNFVKRVMREQRDEFIAELKRIKAGGEPAPEPEYAGAQKVACTIRDIVWKATERERLEEENS